MWTGASGTRQIPSSGAAHLQQRRSQVDGHEDGRQAGVATLHQMDGVEEDHMTRDHQQEEYLCRAMIGS